MEPKRSQFATFSLDKIKPLGWLKNQLDLQAGGLSGYLGEVFPDVGKDSSWLGGLGESWERGPYYLDGVLPLAVITKNTRLYDIANSFVSWSLESQTSDGFFGPNKNLDWWPRMVMLKALMTYSDVDKSGRVEEFILKYFKYQLETLPERPFRRWAKARGFENLIPVYWLYEKTKLSWLLDLSELIKKQTLDWTTFFLEMPFKEKMTNYFDFTNVDWKFMDLEGQNSSSRDMFHRFSFSHVVNVAMALKAPWYYYLIDGEDKNLKAALEGYDSVMRYHGTANYLFTGDEHLAGLNPSQGTELCAVVELMFSLEKQLVNTGLAKFGTLLEKVAFNALPAAIAPDFWSHQYDQQANQILCTGKPHPWINNSPDANIFGLEPNYGCCTVDFHQGWPKFVAHTWLKAEDGVVLAVYAPSKLTYETVDGREVYITEDTDYPFRDHVKLKFKMAEPAFFTLYLRDLDQKKNVKITLNGALQSCSFDPRGYLCVTRTWVDGDELLLNWTLSPKLRYWQNNMVSVERGSLILAMPLGEKWVKVGGVSPALDYEVYPEKDWNYGLNPDESNFKTEFHDVELQPFNCSKPPMVVTTKAKQVLNWEEELSSPGPVPEEPRPGLTCPISLIPYGAARLRITQFPICK
ncbi:MAG: glycoside hydrolase family 127 protein [Firmicutes bacterium]|nr:glycoside hydrolase family 127 protein [Bacillota bacterium]